MQGEINSELILIIVVFFLFLLVIFFIVLAIAVRYRKRKKENEEMKALFSEQLLKSQLEIQEQTLQYVSREIHDNLGQIASLIKINLNTVQLEDQAASEIKLRNTKELVKSLITDLKILSTSLNSDKISRAGLVRGLQLEIDKINKTDVFKASLVQHNMFPEIDNEKAIIIYRMCQEILNNSMKHSEAQHLFINIYYQGNTFILKISDDGIGFNPTAKIGDVDNIGNGLVNLQNRARAINGSVQFTSAPGKGSETTITMKL